MSTMKVLVFGSKSKCGSCIAYAKKSEAQVIILLAGKSIGYEFLDQTSNAKGYNAGAKIVGSANIKRFPQLFAVEGTKVLGTLYPSSMTATEIAKKVAAWCKDCTPAATPAPVTAAKPATCPTCKQPIAIAAAAKKQTVKKTVRKLGLFSVVALTMLGLGCRNIGGDYTVVSGVGADAKTTAVKISCQSLFWPSELSGAELTFPGPANSVPGKIVIGSYKSTGGAAEMVPLVDSTGKTVGYFVGGAAKAAVLP